MGLVYPYEFPTIDNEIMFAEICATDDELDEFEATKEFARAYQVWVSEKVKWLR